MISLRPLVITAHSSQLFKFSTIFLTSRFTFIYTLSSHHKNVLFFIPRHARPKEGGNRFVCSLFKTWRQKAIPGIRKSNVIWKYVKEIVQLQGT